MSPLTLPIPLRDTTAWGAYREAKPIPHRYGRTGGELLQYDDTRTRFVWADHPCEAIDAVLVADVDFPEFRWVVERDSTGTPITFVLFDQPVPEGQTVFARGRGKLHPTTGLLMDRLAPVAWDILANLCGQPVTQSQMSLPNTLLRYTIAGSLDSIQDSAQSVLRDLATSIGARFAMDCPALFFPWPMVSLGFPAYVFTDASEVTASASTDVATIANNLTYQFDVQGGRPRESVQFEAPDSVRSYGRRDAVVLAKWVNTRRDAHAIAQRLLMLSARPIYEVTVNGIAGVVSTGEQVTVSDLAHIPVMGQTVVLSRETNPLSEISAVKVQIPVGSAPRVRLLRQSTALEAQTYVSAEPGVSGADRLFTIREEDGTPIVGAAVTITGVLDSPRYTNAAGIVTIPAYLMPSGEYVLVVQTDDRRLMIPVIVS